MLSSTSQLLQQHWQALQQTRWAKEWDALPLETEADTEEGKGVREKARRLIEKGLRATDDRLLKSLSQGWILALSEGVKQRQHLQPQSALWPRNKEGQTLLHMMAQVKDEQLSKSEYGSAQRRNNWIRAILGYATPSSTSYTGVPSAHQKVLWNQADHQGVTPLMVAMNKATEMHFDEEEWFARDNKGQTAWHHWAKGLVEVVQDYRLQNPSGLSLYKLERDLEPWLKKLELCQDRQWLVGWDGHSYTSYNKQHFQCQEAFLEADFKGKTPFSMLVEGLTQREFVAVFCRELDDDFQWKPKVPFSQSLWSKEEIKTMVHQGYFYVLDKTDTTCLLDVKDWLSLVQNASKINPQCVLQKILTRSLSTAWKWLTTPDEKGECVLDNTSLWEKEDGQGPLYMRLEKWASNKEPYQRWIQAYDGWKMAKVQWEQKRLQQALPSEMDSSSIKPIKKRL